VVEIALPFPKAMPMHDVWLLLISLIKGEHILITEPMLSIDDMAAMHLRRRQKVHVD
jgi:hypothetical protein